MSITINDGVLANLTLLDQRARYAANVTAEALEAFRQGSPSLAIGILIACEQALADADILYRATIALHRSTQPGGGRQ